jgi:hypothetical protein
VSWEPPGRHYVGHRRMKIKREINYRGVKWVVHSVLANRLRSDGFTARQVNRLLRSLTAPGSVRIEYEINISESGLMTSPPRATVVSVGDLRIRRK